MPGSCLNDSYTATKQGAVPRVINGTFPHNEKRTFTQNVQSNLGRMVKSVKNPKKCEKAKALVEYDVTGLVKV